MYSSPGTFLVVVYSSTIQVVEQPEAETFNIHMLQQFMKNALRTTYIYDKLALENNIQVAHIENLNT